jgi:hypothetical protein
VTETSLAQAPGWPVVLAAVFWHLVLFSVILGVINAVDMPTRAMIPDLVEQPEDVRTRWPYTPR